MPLRKTTALGKARPSSAFVSVNNKNDDRKQSIARCPLQVLCLNLTDVRIGVVSPLTERLKLLQPDLLEEC
jgi:hypothetical protein